jgi:hypothetical protein
LKKARLSFGTDRPERGFLSVGYGKAYFISDFANWKDHDAFEAGFARL